MPHLTLGISLDGFALTVLVGRNGKDTTDLVNSGQKVPPPLALRAIIDSGTDMTCVASRVVEQLGLIAIGGVETQTAAGLLNAKFYEVSIGIYPTGNLTSPMLLLEQLHVMELVQPIPNIEVLMGKDVLLGCLLIIDGPRGEFTIAD
jgi:hypothetical protein